MAAKYKGSSVSCQEDLDNHINLSKVFQIRIIGKHQSVLLVCENRIVGAVIRDAALKPVSLHFGTKMKVTVSAHPKINHKTTHKYKGKMIGYDYHKNPKDSFYGTYVYEKKNLDSETQKIYDSNGNTLAKWLYNNAKDHLPWVTFSYDEFKNNAKLSKNDIIDAL